jgi:DNA-binding NtrC family response regulator
MPALGSAVFLGDFFLRPMARLQNAGSETEGCAAAQPKVLVVDDERLLADTTAAILRRAGFNAKTAYGGFEALESMSSFEPDYLLTDIMMPAMNGVELAIAITRMYPGTKILLFSGQAGIAQLLQDCKTQGFEFPMLAKPVHPSKLVEGLKRLGHN